MLHLPSSLVSLFLDKSSNFFLFRVRTWRHEHIHIVKVLSGNTKPHISYIHSHVDKIANINWAFRESLSGHLKNLSQYSASLLSSKGHVISPVYVRNATAALNTIPCYSNNLPRPRNLLLEPSFFFLSNLVLTFRSLRLLYVLFSK